MEEDDRAARGVPLDVQEIAQRLLEEVQPVHERERRRARRPRRAPMSGDAKKASLSIAKVRVVAAKGGGLAESAGSTPIASVGGRASDSVRPASTPISRYVAGPSSAWNRASHTR